MTVGIAAAWVLSMTGEAVLKGFVTEGVKDAYRALKAKVAVWASSDVEALERTPTSENRKAVIAEEIDRLSSDDKAKIQSLALALIEELKKAQQRGPIGVDIGRLEAAEVDLKKINVSEGTGFAATEVKTTGKFTIEEITVGTAGKAKG